MTFRLLRRRTAPVVFNWFPASGRVSAARSSPSLARSCPLSGWRPVVVKFSGVAGRRVFLYVVRGSIAIEGERVAQFNLAELHEDGDVVELEANDNAVLLFGHADPIQEPIAARGPFVMNTQTEVDQVFADFRSGNFNVSAG
jgi:hypothetical protein